MFGVFGFIIVFVLAMLFAGALFVFRIIYSLFNLRNQFNRMGDNMRDSGKGRSRTSGKETVSDNRPQQRADRKIFSDDEGEYVDFEEVE